MNEKSKVALTVALIALLIIFATLLLAHMAAENTGALSAIIFGLLLVSAIHAITGYKLRCKEMDVEKEIALNSFHAPPDDRVIVYNSPKNKMVSDKIITLTPDLSLQRQELTDFVIQSLADDGPKLAISRWKTLGWEQEVVERLLDYLNSLGLITARENGRACTYIDPEITPGRVLREIESRAI